MTVYVTAAELHRLAAELHDTATGFDTLAAELERGPADYALTYPDDSVTAELLRLFLP